MKKILAVVAALVVIAGVALIFANRKINPDECRKKIIEEFTPETYPFISEISADIQQSNISFIMIVNDGASKDEALKTMESAIKKYNEHTKEYKMFTKSSSDTYYGGFYDDHDMFVSSIEMGQVLNDQYLVQQYIPKGQHIPLSICDTEYAKNHN